MQIVGVKILGGPARVYTYLWRDSSDPLEVGDVVWIPPNYVNKENGKARVVSTGPTEWKGAMSFILGRVKDG